MLSTTSSTVIRPRNTFRVLSNVHVRPHHPLNSAITSPPDTRARLRRHSSRARSSSAVCFATRLPVIFADPSNCGNEVVDALADEVKGKNVLVTGTSLNGIGFETARATAKYANLVVITGYNEERLQLSKDALLRAVPSGNIRTLVLDLSSLVAVRKAAAEVNAYPETLHVLINNAAATAGVYALTPENFEQQIAAGHIGPFLFTSLLMPKILAASESSTYTPRVVFVSSIGHTYSPALDLDDTDEFLRGHGGPKGSDPNATPLLRYGQVKAANIMTAKELAKRAGGRVLAYSLHPGVIWTNAFAKGLKPELTAVGLVNAEGKPNEEAGQWKTLSQGAATTLVAAFDPRIRDHSGTYLDDCVVAEEKIAPHSADPVRTKKLWEKTEDAIGEKFRL
uniref:Short-chain dehydrogenase/reductase family protein n=1 Tax=Mycena chlorophos TaxID=658473 RepID=A0ABQ0MCW1_MYCCL|nr:short-chain dehydrogenase/reductase family protein [Mycena chlorophos]